MAMNNLPMWAKVVAVVGIPGAIAFWLLWLFTNVLTSLGADVKSHVTQDPERTRLLRAICMNTAPDSAARSNCLE